jgi:hypothetical protein
MNGSINEGLACAMCRQREGGEVSDVRVRWSSQHGLMSADAKAARTPQKLLYDGSDDDLQRSLVHTELFLDCCSSDQIGYIGTIRRLSLFLGFGCVAFPSNSQCKDSVHTAGPADLTLHPLWGKPAQNHCIVCVWHVV